MCFELFKQRMGVLAIYVNFGKNGKRDTVVDLTEAQNLVGAAWFLVPGVGAQGGSSVDAVAGARPDGLGCLVNSSRGVLYPSKDAQESYDENPKPCIMESAISHSKRFQFDD